MDRNIEYFGLLRLSWAVKWAFKTQVINKCSSDLLLWNLMKALQSCKLQQEAEQLLALLAQEEACSRGYQNSRKLQQTKRQMQGERYFKRKRNSGETGRRCPPDFKTVSATVRVDDGNYRSELHGFRQWVDRLEFMPDPGLHRRPLHKSLYHRGWKVRRLEEETEHLCFAATIQYSLDKFGLSET